MTTSQMQGDIFIALIPSSEIRLALRQYVGYFWFFDDEMQAYSQFRTGLIDFQDQCNICIILFYQSSGLVSQTLFVNCVAVNFVVQKARYYEDIMQASILVVHDEDRYDALVQIVFTFI